MSYLNILLFSILDTEERNSIDYKIATYLLMNAEKLIGCSLSDIARDCHVSKASISRFCRKIGLLDYTDLQMLIRVAQIERENIACESRTIKDCSQVFFEKLKEVEKNIEEIVKLDITKELIMDILEYENIACFGHLQSGNMAAELRHNLSIIHKLAYYSKSLVAQQMYLDEATSQNLIIIFSATGRYFQRLHINKKRLMKKDKPKIYLITASKITMNLPYVDHIIELSQEYDDNMSHISMQIYVNYLTFLFQNMKQSCTY